MIQFETLDNGKAKVIITEDLASVLKSYAAMIKNYGTMYDALRYDSEELRPHVGDEEMDNIHQNFWSMDGAICAVLGNIVCAELVEVEEV